MINQQKEELQRFISTWSHQGKEVGDKETYWNTLLRILGVPQAILDARAKYPDSSLADLYEKLRNCLVAKYTVREIIFL